VFFSQCAQVSGKSTENHNNNFVHDGDVWGMNFFFVVVVKDDDGKWRVDTYTTG